MNRKLAGLSVLAFLTVAPALLRGDTRIERTLRLEPGGEFRFDGTGSVTITGSSDSGAHIVITSKRSDLEELFDFQFEERPGGVTLVARRKRHFLFDIGNYGSLRFEVRVPAETSLSIDTSGGSIQLSRTRRGGELETSGGSVSADDVTGTLDIDTSGGSITVERLEGDLRARTSGGSVRVADVKGRADVQTSGGNISGDTVGGPLRARTSGGSVVLKEIGGDLNAQSSGGSIRISGARGRVDANTSGGSINAEFTKGNAAGGTLETSGGGIRVSVDPSVNLEIDASGGPVTLDVPLRVKGEVSRRHLRGLLGAGGAMLRLHASGGSVLVRPLGESTTQ
jgi:DUF4097 and DUF4098 domain-containing protein YvlB